MPFTVVSLALPLLLFGVAPADSASGNTATVTVAPGGIRVQWNASCGVQDYWAVNVWITHQDGSKANGAGYIFDNNGGKQPSAAQDMVWSVQILPSLKKETFHAQVTLSCPNNGSNVVIGEQSVTLGLGCNPGPFNKAQREFALADQFHTLGEQELKTAWKVVKNFAWEYAKALVLEGGAKLAALKALKRFAPAAFAVLAPPTEALAAAVSAEEILLKGIPLWADYIRDVTAANEDLARGDAYAAKAEADLQAAKDLCLDPLEQQLNKLLGDEKQDKQAHQIIQKWQGDANRNLSPITHDLGDEATALKQATSQLGGAHASAAGKPVTITTVQLRAGIRDLNSALADDRAIRRHLAAITADQNATLTQLKALFGT